MSTPRVLHRKLIAALLLLAAAASFASPRPALADTQCTNNYEACIASAAGKNWIMRELAYQECFWTWAGCVLRDII
jgi:hypothetical protein